MPALRCPDRARDDDLRSTFASNALAAGVTVFELAKLMGTSVKMIEEHYGTLIGGAHAGMTGRLDALEASLEASAEAEAERRSSPAGPCRKIARSLREIRR